MVTLVVEGISLLLAVILVGLAAKKWHIIRDRHLVLSLMKLALNERRAFWIGTLLGIFYLAVFMILGGKGGRIHVLFGRLIINATPWEMVIGLALAILVMISMTLFVYGVQVMGLRQSGKKGGVGFFGALLALLASFCP
jgi:hypothetical protein